MSNLMTPAVARATIPAASSPSVVVLKVRTCVRRSPRRRPGNRTHTFTSAFGHVQPGDPIMNDGSGAGATRPSAARCH